MFSKKLLRGILTLGFLVTLFSTGRVNADEDTKKMLTVYNKGKGGQNSSEGSKRFERDVLTLKPDYVFIYFGLNETLNEPKFLSEAKYVENLEWMVNQARKAKIKPVLCTIHSIDEELLLKRHKKESYGSEGPNGKIDRYNQALRKLAKEKQIAIAHFDRVVATEEQHETPLVSADGVHLTPFGYKKLAHCFFEVVASEIEDNATIVCLGDSVTRGAGVKGAGTTTGDTYPAYLSKVIVNKRKGVNEKICGQLIQYYISKSPSDEKIAIYTNTLTPVGTWPDINYKSTRRSGWDMVAHLGRLKAMSTAYANPDSSYYCRPDLKEKILTGLDHWIQNDYRNPNWFNARIGVPKHIAPTFLLLGKDLPQAMLEKALKTVLNRTKIEMTGQNKVWCSGIVLMRSLLIDDKVSIEKASQAIWGELKVSAKEGVQQDWTFHQHGPQLQVGGYGRNFCKDMVKWGIILRGTPYAPSHEKFMILRNLMLESLAWFYWKGRWDLSACGRQVRKGCQVGKAKSVVDTLNEMIYLDPENAHRYTVSTYQLLGFKGFWRSDVAVARRPEWYASVRMVSTRTIGAETCNSENMLGLHQADGVLLHYRTGREYENIQPLWDWRRLPGTTCDQGIEKLRPSGRGKSSFVGVVGDSQNGVSAMIYKRKQLSANKAWFIFGDRIVCLGAGIKGESQGSVMTSIEQNLHGSTAAVSSVGPLGKGMTHLKSNDWVHHNGAGYRLMTGGTVSIETVKGSWKNIFPTRPESDATGEVFSIYLDHGKSPGAATYAYTVFPNISVEKMNTSPATIVSNTNLVQAVTLNGDISAVFYAPGKIIVDGKVLEVNKPCLLMKRKGKIFLSDPTQVETSLTISYGDFSKTVSLPIGLMAGSTVKYDY